MSFDTPPVWVDDEPWPRTTRCRPGYDGCDGYGIGHACEATSIYPESFDRQQHTKSKTPPTNGE